MSVMFLSFDPLLPIGLVKAERGEASPKTSCFALVKAIGKFPHSFFVSHHDDGRQSFSEEPGATDGENSTEEETEEDPRLHILRTIPIWYVPNFVKNFDNEIVILLLDDCMHNVQESNEL